MEEEYLPNWDWSRSRMWDEDLHLYSQVVGSLISLPTPVSHHRTIYTSLLYFAFKLSWDFRVRNLGCTVLWTLFLCNLIFSGEESPWNHVPDTYLFIHQNVY